MLVDIKPHVKFKLFALWSALMFCYVYGDYFEFYQPGKLQEMLTGRWAYGPVTEGSLLGLPALMAVPCVMGCVSLIFPAQASRWLNIFWGIVCTVIQILTGWGSWNFYIFFEMINIVLTLSIVYLAWTWPRETAVGATDEMPVSPAGKY